MLIDQSQPHRAGPIREILPEELDRISGSPDDPDKISGAMMKLGGFHCNGDLDPFDLLRL
jgi:hypothetical protein